MLSFLTISTLYIYQSKASFLQCSPSDSLESLDDLGSSEKAEKQGVICGEWPFYSGGFAKHVSASSSSSEEDGDGDSLLPDSISSDSKLYGFDDGVETHQCLESGTNFCSKWVVTKQEYEDPAGCGRYGDAVKLLTEYQLCLCADDNYGNSENTLLSQSTTAEASNEAKYCSKWACLETAEYPRAYNAYSLVMDNHFVMRSKHWKGSSSSSSSEDDSEDDENNGDYYRFAENGKIMELDESMELKNCWCKSSSLNGEYCLNWYCETLEHDEFGCHKKGFGVEDYGWFGCYDDAEDVESTECQQWYGFLIDNEQRDEYRCQCVDIECVSWICGLKEVPLRRNYMWYNFWLALILWGCLCGCCGTKICFKRKFTKCCKFLQCRKCRMALFYILFGFISIIHGGIPAFLFFVIISFCSLCCAIKCENCKCCSKNSRCKMMKQCDAKQQLETNNGPIKTANDGEDSREKSESKEEKVTKSGHVRVDSIESVEVEMDDHSVEVEMDGNIQTNVDV